MSGPSIEILPPGPTQNIEVQIGAFISPGGPLVVIDFAIAVKTFAITTDHARLIGQTLIDAANTIDKAMN